LTYDSESKVVNPSIIKAGVHAKGGAFVTERENEQKFYRTKLNGKLRFQRESFHFINNAPFESEFIINVTENSIEVFNGVFYKTDCDFDQDKATLVVQPNPSDNYKTVLEGLEREFNLVEIAEETKEVNYKKSPLIQLYIAGSSSISNHVIGTYWELAVETPVFDEYTLENDYFFKADYPTTYLPPADNLPAGASGNYLNSTAPNVSQPIALKVYTNGVFSFQLVNVGDPNDPHDPEKDVVVWELYEIATLKVVFTGVNDESLGETTFRKNTDPNITFQVFSSKIYARYLTDQATVNGAPTNDLPSSDIISTELGYKYVLPINVTSIVPSSESALINQGFGRYPNSLTEYFVKPIYTETLFPLSRSTWSINSLWFYYTPTLLQLVTDGAKAQLLKDGYSLHGVISGLLNNIDSSITFSNDSSYSQFLYGLPNPISTAFEPKIIITPITNITVGEYDQPANKSLIKLSEVLNMLRGVYKLFWFIDSSNKLRLEHVNYFENGGSYSSPIIGTDLTQIIEPKTGKKWGFLTSKYKFDKIQMPDRMTFKWGGDASEPFKGYDIVIRSNFVEKGNIKEITIAKFVTDLDFLLSQPNEFSKESFVLLGVTGVDILKVEYTTITKDANVDWIAQNGNLSFTYLHDKFHRHGLPASKVTINEQDITASSVQRHKLQEINFPSATEPNAMQLVTTALGNGKIDKLDRNLSSKFVKATLRHDTES